MRDFYLCYPAILINTLVPQLVLSSILQNQLGMALDALTDTSQDKWHLEVFSVGSACHLAGNNHLVTWGLDTTPIDELRCCEVER